MHPRAAHSAAATYRHQAADTTWSGSRSRSGALALAYVADGRSDAYIELHMNSWDCVAGLLLPGMANVHSHAFQRLLRGRTEFVAAGHASDDFWSWRELMYRAAATLGPEDLYAVSRQAFLEMALAGITAVGEFHYLHHTPSGAPYADRSELAGQVVRAARDVGLRIALLRVAYARAGFGVAENPRQRRFLEPDVDTFLRATADLRAAVRTDPLVSVGIAPHSVRAVPRPWLEALAALPRQITHLHVAEQPIEVAACLAEHRLRPVELLEEVGLLHPQLTAVHAIHLEPQEISLLARAGARVCACPSTEQNLGDGVVPADLLAAKGIELSLGSDSQARIDLLEEARLLEGNLRLTRGRRAVLDPGGGEPSGLAASLFERASRGGALSLGLPSGQLSPGAPADFFTIDLHHPSVAGVPPEALLAGIVFAAEKSAIREVFVQGRAIVEQGQHPMQGEIQRGYQAALERLQT